MELNGQVYCQVQTQSEVPVDDAWLSPRELAVLYELRFEKKRSDWRLGRWNAKLALTRCLPDQSATLSDWEIIAGPEGAPVVFLAGESAQARLSLSHSRGQSLVALCGSAHDIGCDMEWIESRSRSFEETFFTDFELDYLAQGSASHRDCLVTLIWSAKESVLKALGKGLQIDTRLVEITPVFEIPNDGWQALSASDARTNCSYHGWWRNERGMIHTLITGTRMLAPVVLR